MILLTGFVDTKAPQKKNKEAITDELTTIPGVNVTVNPDFSLKVDGFKKEQVEEEDIEDDSENSDNEVSTVTEISFLYLRDMDWLILKHGLVDVSDT